MLYPKLPVQDWAALVGDEGKNTGALVARDRKLVAFSELSEIIFPLATRLSGQGALFTASADVLADEPYAARWYLDLAGLTRKTLSKIRSQAINYGLKTHPDSIAARRQSGKPVPREALEAFAEWINNTLQSLYPEAARTQALALTAVVGMAGARVDGQVRIKSGEDAVLILKSLLVGEFNRRGHTVEVEVDGGWVDYLPNHDLLIQRRLRFAGQLVAEFVPGGNRPDMKLSVDGVTVLVAEVKGRTDLSNVWESWMPQINGHLQTWAGQISQAPRVFFGTIITDEMIHGRTKGRTIHTGLRAFSDSGLLSGAYNLSNVAAGQELSVRAFRGFIDSLVQVLN